MAEYSGIPVNVSMLPSEPREAIPVTITTDEFKARLKSGGTLVLDGNQLIIGEPNFSEDKFLFLALDKLILRNGAGIVTGGNTAVIFVNELESENGAIVSFTQEKSKADTGANGSYAGAPGMPGKPGDSGGFVSIHVIKSLTGILHVDLRGQDGGDGGHGAQGSKGERGQNGEDSYTGPGNSFPFLLTCVRQAKAGYKGGIGMPGGNGGNGGSGGQGGIFQLINIGVAPIPQTSFTFKADPGMTGNGGNGGTGGEGGDGGSGGRGSIQCHGANSGPQGDRGQNGAQGVSGQQGAQGRAVVKNLDIEVVVRIATAPPTAAQG